MTTFFLFILLVLLTVGQALQYGAADNDTFILTKLTLEDIFGTRNLDKRGPFLRKKTKKGKFHKPISVVLHKHNNDRWYIEMPLDGLPNFGFDIDTYGICSSVPLSIGRFSTGPVERDNIHCPGRNHDEFVAISGFPRPSRIPIGPVTAEGDVIGEQFERVHGILGWTLGDSRVPEGMHLLPGFLSKFESPIFAIYLPERSTNGRLDIGTADDHDFEIEYHDVLKLDGHHQPWLIKSLSILVGGTMIGPPGIAKTAFDSTTPYIYGPLATVNEIKNKIRYATTSENAEVSFQWEGKKPWPLRPKSPERVYYWEWYADLFKGHEDMEDWVLGTAFWIGKNMVHKGGSKPEMGIGELRSQIGRPVVRPPVNDDHVPPPPYAPPSHAPPNDAPPPYAPQR